VEARFSAPVQTGPGTYSASSTMGTGSFPGVKSGRTVSLNPHPLLVPWSRKSRAIPLLPLCAVRPVQSISACTRVHVTFTFTLYSISSLNTCCYVSVIPQKPVSCELIMKFHAFIEHEISLPRSQKPIPDPQHLRRKPIPYSTTLLI